ncbi:LutC/YkgG family protein [Wenyingzhuangia sp. IMCC45574]
MGSRNQILERIKNSKPESIALPAIDAAIFDEGLDLLKEFTKKVEVVGGNVFQATSYQDIIEQSLKMYPGTKKNLSTIEELGVFNTVSLEEVKTPDKLEDLDLFVVKTSVAVAENGAFWLEHSDLPMRVLPFITKHLVVILKEEDILPYMHQAYNKLGPSDYGVFISGPSKTADIEQSLVIGAHGALSLSVFVLK